MSRFPTPDLQQRLLGNGGRVPNGLFRPNYYRSKRSRANPAAAALAANPTLLYELDALRNMLRDLTNVNVRQPSHLAPPFRATQFLFQTFLNATNVDPVTITMNGNDAVPIGSNAVVYWVSYVFGPTFNGVNTVPAWGETFASTLPLQMQRNGQAIPGLGALLPAYQHGVQISSGADYNTQWSGPPAPPLIPIPLLQGDSISFTNVIGGGTGEAYFQVAGYIYPIEIDGDGVRGTLADRG